MTIAPGIFETPLLMELPDKVLDSSAKWFLIRHLGKPEEFASLSREIVENQYLNGEVIWLDGTSNGGQIEK
ncbi:MAG: hypothetical protein R2875_14275 [Desulfobacterales bacterium]